jgi:hypothetical protein
MTGWTGFGHGQLVNIFPLGLPDQENLADGSKYHSVIILSFC